MNKIFPRALPEGSFVLCYPALRELMSRVARVKIARGELRFGFAKVNVRFAKFDRYYLLLQNLESLTNSFALSVSPSRFTGKGVGDRSRFAGAKLLDIGKADVDAQNSSTRKTSALLMKKPSRLREGWEGSQRGLRFKQFF